MTENPLGRGLHVIDILFHRVLRCPNCDGKNLDPLEYGYGTRGGCVVSYDSPQVVCNYCGHCFLTNQEANDIYEKFELHHKRLTDEYLMHEFVLANESEVSHYMKNMAIYFLQDENSLVHLRLLDDARLQPAIKQRLDWIRAKSS